MIETDAVRAVEDNLFDAWRALAGIPNVEYHRSPKMIRYISGVPFPLCNSIMRANFSPEDPGREVREALAPFKSRRLPMFWWTGPATRPVGLEHRLQEEGLLLTERVPGMAAELHSIETTIPAPLDLEIREVRDGKSLDAWIEVFRIGNELPEGMAAFFHNAMFHIGFHQDVPYKHYLGLWRDQPVACSSVYLGDGAAGLYNVTTLPAFRGRGIGSAVTLRLIRVAKDRGATLGILHATRMGLPIYRKMGFTECCELGIYLWQP